jgi:hypothetical protein
MAGDPKKGGRRSDGTFAPGNRLGGSRKGSRHKTTLAVEALLDGEAEGLTRKAIELALDGDGPALRLCLDRIAPPRKDAPIAFSLPPIDTAEAALKASSALLAALAAGEVTPYEAGQVMNLLASHRQLIETSDLEARVTKLENRS